MTVSKELSRYRLNLVGVQEVGWEAVAPDEQGSIHFFYGKGNKNHELGTVFCTKENHISS
jgi:hypothetical protein